MHVVIVEVCVVVYGEMLKVPGHAEHFDSTALWPSEILYRKVCLQVLMPNAAAHR